MFKAVSDFLEDKFDVRWKDIEIINDNNGRPMVNLGSNLKKTLGDNGKIDVSISHVNQTAVASAVVQIEKCGTK